MSSVSGLIGGVIWAKVFLTKSHILGILLTLEFFMLTNLSLLGGMMLNLLPNYLFIFLFFTCSVCEACVGVGLLVKYVREVGSDLLNLLS